MRPVKGLAERLWPLVAGPWCEGVAESDCWIWIGSGAEYGRFRRGRRSEGHIGPHRAALMLATGTDPAGLVARHRCDSPRCCNPAHLEWGSQAENVADMARKGRAWWQRRSGVNWGRAARQAAEAESAIAELEAAI